MKIFTKFSLFLISLGFASCNTSEMENSYTLFWEENFNDNTIDESSWSKIPRGKVEWSKYMSDHESLYEIKNGKLALYGRVNNGVVPSDTARYLTGGVYTKGKKTISYGKVEIKARLEAAQGAWPAFWMLPSDGNWPKGGEIDIMERLNHDAFAHQTIHTYYTLILGKNREPINYGIGKIDPHGYNLYAVEILPDKLIFSINKKPTLIYPRLETEEEGQFPFGGPFYLLIDMQIEGSWAGKANPKQYPIKMEIDWVKMYELIQEEDNIPSTN